VIHPTTEQLAIITAIEGPLLVLAPVGSGKTSVLALRLQQAIETGYTAAQCLCLTFTNKAARELRERYRLLPGKSPDSAKPPLICTFHAFCASLLKTEAAIAGLPADFSVYDETDSQDLMLKIFRRLNKTTPVFSGPQEQQLATKLYYKWGQILSNVKGSEIKSGSIPRSALDECSEQERDTFKDYVSMLASRNAVDFPLLVYRARSLLLAEEAVRKRWANKYSWIQVDEVQDTHHSEWDMVSFMARQSGNLALFGDLDQTIYGWRGSSPNELLQNFKHDFPTFKKLQISLNQRGTKSILQLAAQVAEKMPDRHTTIKPVESLPDGEPVNWILAEDPETEAEEIATQIKQLFTIEPGSQNSTAVLVRGASQGRQVKRILEGHGIKALNEDDLKITRRPEIKALLAPMMLIANPDDLAALRKWLIFCARSSSMTEALGELYRCGNECHLRVTDMLDIRTLDSGDPFQLLLKSWRERFVVVLDFETTGLDKQSDDIIEIAAQRYSGNLEVDRFHRLLRTDKNLEESSAVHGISTEMLKTNAVDPEEGLRDLLAWLGSDIIVGHNIAFDLGMLYGQCRRLHIICPQFDSCDTLKLARRVIKTGSMKLGSLQKRLQLNTKPTHRAMDDVSATAELLNFLIAKILVTRDDREQLINQFSSIMRPWADKLHKWAVLASNLQTWELAEFVKNDPAFSAQIKHDSPEEQRINDLIRQFKILTPELSPLESDKLDILRNTLNRCVLAHPSDMISEGSVPILTIHAAKGMEFDHVFLYQMAHDIIPDFRSKNKSALNEERRVLYVAITRARKSLTISAAKISNFNRQQGWSEFVEGVIDT
jgi:DNA helicase II / ATP-dependent DNA helicase PcrA